MMKRTYLALAALFAQACRFGGDELGKGEGIDVEAGLPAAEAEADASSVGDEVITRDGGPHGGGADAAHAAADAKTAISDAQRPAVRDASSASCGAPPGLACDPVSGEGCFPFTQCLVDPSSSEPAAYCVLSGIQLDLTCTQDEFSTDCPPQHTCVMGACRKYCYCDADCESGAACTSPTGEGGSPLFKLCER